MSNYSEMADTEFDEILTEIVSGMSAEQILGYGDVNMFFREEFNNQVLSLWEARNPEKASKPKPVPLRGDRISVEDQVWERFLHGTTPETFLSEYDSPEDAVKDLVENLDSDDLEIFKTDWGAELTLEEVLLSFLKRRLEM